MIFQNIKLWAKDQPPKGQTRDRTLLNTLKKYPNLQMQFYVLAALKKVASQSKTFDILYSLFDDFGGKNGNRKV